MIRIKVPAAFSWDFLGIIRDVVVGAGCRALGPGGMECCDGSGFTGFTEGGLQPAGCCSVDQDNTVWVGCK